MESTPALSKHHTCLIDCIHMYRKPSSYQISELTNWMTALLNICHVSDLCLGCCGTFGACLWKICPKEYVCRKSNMNDWNMCWPSLWNRLPFWHKKKNKVSDRDTGANIATISVWRNVLALQADLRSWGLYSNDSGVQAIQFYILEWISGFLQTELPAVHPDRSHNFVSTSKLFIIIIIISVGNA